jgi:uncharacterized small protein (DUF1192 family)
MILGQCETDSLLTLEHIVMRDETGLLPPIWEISQRITILTRERHRLRALLKLAVEAREDAERLSLPTAPPETPGREDTP